jgi:hypothetical protein
MFGCLDAAMRTSVDFPDDLIFRVQERAALEGRKPEDLIATYVEAGLREGPAPPSGARLPGGPLPDTPAVARGMAPEPTNGSMTEGNEGAEAGRLSSSELPVIPATGMPIFALTNAEIAHMEEEEDLDRFARSVGR